MIVVDTNIIAYLALPTSYTEAAERLLVAEPEWAAPLLWRSEFLNVLALYLRKRLITLEQAIIIQAETAALLHGREYEVPASDVLTLIEQSPCSAYDCEFVALALGLNIPLVTMDRKLIRYFPKVAQSLTDWAP